MAGHDWRRAQGLDAYETYIEERERDTARQDAIEAREEALRGNAFDAQFLYGEKSSKPPIRLFPGEMTKLLQEERAGLVEIEREDGRVVSIQRIGTQ